MKATALGTIKRGYAAGAQATGRLLERVGILGEDPPPRHDRLRHWAYSLTKAHDSIGIAELDVPWWTYGAIDEVERWLAGREGDVRAFEWGSGASTIWLARRVASVNSVEHHREFGTMIQAQLSAWPNALLDIVEPVPSETPAIGSAKEGHGGLDFSAYVRHIDSIDGMFDLIVVDGRAREACLSAALRPPRARRDHRVRQHDAPPLPPGDRRCASHRAHVPRPHADPPLPRPNQHPHPRLTTDGRPAVTAPSEAPIGRTARSRRRLTSWTSLGLGPGWGRSRCGPRARRRRSDCVRRSAPAASRSPRRPVGVCSCSCGASSSSPSSDDSAPSLARSRSRAASSRVPASPAVDSGHSPASAMSRATR